MSQSSPSPFDRRVPRDLRILDEAAESEARVIDESHGARLNVALADVMTALRDADRCPSCRKTRVVLNISTRGFRPERITPEIHCACAPDGPAYRAPVSSSPLSSLRPVV